MSDIVERLKAVFMNPEGIHEAPFLRDDWCRDGAKITGRDVVDAIDEIERLRDELESVLNECEGHGYPEATPNMAGNMVSSEPTAPEVVQYVINELQVRARVSEDEIERLRDKNVQLVEDCEYTAGLVMDEVRSAQLAFQRADAAEKRLEAVVLWISELLTLDWTMEKGMKVAGYVRCVECDGDGHIQYRVFDGTEEGHEECDSCDCTNGWRRAEVTDER